MIRFVLQIQMAAMAALATILLGMGQVNFVMPMLMVFVALTSVIFTDRLKWFWMNRYVSYLAMGAAAVFSLGDFLVYDSTRKLLAIANMLMFVQIVLLYQRKDARVYWHLVVVGLLQVVVASLIMHDQHTVNYEWLFSILVTIYTVLTLLALCVFFIVREATRYERAEGEADDPPARRTRPRTRFKELLEGDPRVEFQREAGQVSASHLTRGYGRTIGGLTVAALMFTAIFFVAVPRTPGAFNLGRGGRMRIGFSDTIKLDKIGKLMESDETVMRVTFVRPGEETPIRVVLDPYFRGVVLTQYTSNGSAWSAGHPATHRPRPLRNWNPPPNLELIHQHIGLQPTNSRTLFSVSPAWNVGATPVDVQLDPSTDRISRRAKDDNRAYTYVVGISGMRANGGQSRFLPHRGGPVDPYELTLMSRDGRVDESDFTHTIALAREIIKAEGVENGTDLEKAIALESHLRFSGNFAYSLDSRGLPRQYDDPIENFVASHRTGHCEYFASALALMLRSQNIPSRVIVGYRGGEFNTIGGYVQVQQKHAHAWVECWIDRLDLPADYTERSADVDGFWYRLDPTPGVQTANVALADDSLIGKAEQFLDYFQLVCLDFAVGTTELESTPSETSSDADLKSPFSRLQDLLDSPGVKRVMSWILWVAIGAFPVTMLLGILARWTGLVKFDGQLFAAFVRRGGDSKQRARRPAAAPVDFYVRLEQTFRRFGIRREPDQTQREFAIYAVNAIASPPQRPAAHRLALSIVDEFYEVRFGGIELSASQQAALDESLAELKTTLAESG